MLYTSLGKGIVVHRTINEKMVQLLKKALDLYGQAQIKQAIALTTLRQDGL